MILSIIIKEALSLQILKIFLNELVSKSFQFVSISCNMTILNIHKNVNPNNYAFKKSALNK